MRSARKSVVAVLSVTLLMSLWLAGCGPTNGLPALTGEFLYVSNSGDGTISEFSINTTTGALTNIGTFKTMAYGSTFEGELLEELVVHPTNEFIYVSDEADNDVLGFDIGDQSFSGLIFLQNSKVAVNQPFGLAITPNGGSLYATNSGAVDISEYSLDLTNGALTSIGTIASGSGPFDIAVESTGRYAYAANDSSVSEYLVQPSGNLTANGTLVLPVFSTNLDHIATAQPAQSTACAYVTNQQLGLVYEMAIDSSSGTLTYLGNVSANGAPFGITVHPNQKFIYTANANSFSISVFEQVSASSATQGTAPCTIALTSQLSLPSALSPQPFNIAIEPTGKFAYSGNFNFGKVGEYSIDPTTGALTSIAVIDDEVPPNPESGPVYAATTH
jgi:6-phosphogluconolactonase (cycloisomerase 2 family)